MSNLEDKVEKARALAEATVAALSEDAAPGPSGMKRLTIDVSEDLHRRIKMGCAARGEKMADVIRNVLENVFRDGR
jgi:hypothetical protein